MSLNSNFSKICRTCLTTNVNMKSVFDKQVCIEKQVSFSEILTSFTSLKVFKGDGLPEQICVQCVEEINRIVLFKRLCLNSDSTLQQCIQTILPLPKNENVHLYCPTIKYVGKLEVDNRYEIINKKFCKNYLDIKDEEQISNDQVENYVNKIDSNNSFLEESFTEGNEVIEGDASNQMEEVRIKSNQSHKFKDKRKVYPCKECDKLCLGLGKYRQHMIEVHTQNFKCNTCKKRFISEISFKKHSLIHNTSDVEDNDKNDTLNSTMETKHVLPRTCNICSKTFRFHSNLERHKLIHTGEKPYLCNVCGKGFAQLSYLKIHSFIHTGEKPYHCKMCNRSFAAPGTLMTHIRTHTGERPHVCKICGKNFPQSGYLSAHIRTHTGEKPVECKICQRRFNQSGRLIIHMRMHSGEKPYKCKECERSFAVKGTLTKHIRTHTGERPYTCSVCGQAFAQSGTLSTHMKVHRPK